MILAQPVVRSVSEETLSKRLQGCSNLHKFNQINERRETRNMASCLAILKELKMTAIILMDRVDQLRQRIRVAVLIVSEFFLSVSRTARSELRRDGSKEQVLESTPREQNLFFFAFISKGLFYPKFTKEQLNIRNYVTFILKPTLKCYIIEVNFERFY